MLALERGIRGAIGGVVATLPMTAIMFGARRLGMMRELPPETITNAMLDAVDREPQPVARRALAAIGHLGYGAGCGALFSTVVPRTSRVNGAVLGAAFGAAVWLASYQGWLPALGIMPAASRDRPSRPAAMLVAHLVFGAVLGALTGRSTRAGQR